MKKNNYFENVFENLFNHTWLKAKSSGSKLVSVGSLVKNRENHRPRGKCYIKMHNMYWSSQK